MEWSRAIQYLVIINTAGFLLAAADAWMRRKTGRQMGAVLMGISLPGGALGVLAGLILLNRRLDKSNMMSRVFVVCLAVLQGALLIFLKNGSRGEITFAFWSFFPPTGCSPPAWCWSTWSPSPPSGSTSGRR